ncbi:MAG TPA: BatA domain-containing protein [Longimicrobiales bacterium]
MGFLSPALLVLGAAVAVPIVLHLFQRHQGPRMVFPAVRYLRRAEIESARRIKLRQLLLLALRVAALALLALAAARPVLRHRGGGHEPTAVALVLDNSLSTGLVQGDRRVLDHLKDRALESIARGTSDDRFWVIRAGAPWEPAIPADPAQAAEIVRATNVVAGAADLGAALERARSLLAAGAEGRATEIQLLTDLQASGLATVTAAGADAPPVIAWAPPEAEATNAAVTAVEVGAGMPPRAGERSTVAANVISSRAGDTIPIRLTIDNRVSAAGAAPAGAAAVLPFPARAAGFVAGWVELDPDALRGDDRRYFVVPVQPPPAVALAGPLPFVDEALGVLSDAGRVRRADPDAADVIFAPAAAGVAAAREGRTAVVVAPASPLELPAANRRLAEAGVPWRFAPGSAAGEARLIVDGEGDALLHALDDVRIRQNYRLEPEPEPGAAGDSVLLRLRDGDAWLVRGELTGGGRYLLVGSSLDEQATTLPTSVGLLPLLDRLIAVWAADAAGSTTADPGAALPLPAAATAVERPDGTRESVPGGTRYRVPGEPGVYRILAGDRTIGAFAVNPPPSESDLARADEDALEAAFPGWDIDLVDDAADWSDAVFRQRLGREVWRPLLLLALAVLLIEGLIAAGGRAGRKTRQPGAVAEPVPAGAGAAGPNRRTS